MKAWDSSGLLFCSLSWMAGLAVAGLAAGLLSLLLAPVPAVPVVIDAPSSSGSVATAAVEDEEEDDESELAAKAPCRSEVEEGDEDGEDDEDVEEEDEEGEEVEAAVGSTTSGSRLVEPSGSSQVELVEAGAGVDTGAGDGAASVQSVSTGASDSDSA